jgi:hypothetical protein
MADRPDTIASLRADLNRAISRIRTLEDIAFRLNPSQAKEAIDGMEAIRNHLRKSEYLSPVAAAWITEQLPPDWRTLAKRHGAPVVFPLLAQNYSIVDARRKLG